MKILIIQTAFIGDVILATAVAEKLHHQFPDAQIDFLLRKGNEALLADHPYIKTVFVWDKKRGKFKNLLSITKQLRANKYNSVINLHRFASSGIITAFSGAIEKIGFDKNPLSFLFTKKIKHEIGNGKHETERNQQLIEHLTDNKAAKPKLYPSSRNYESVKKYKNAAYVCLAPTSVWFTKQYPKEKWIELCNALPKELTIYLLGAPTDVEACNTIKLSTKIEKQNTIINLSGKLNFLESAALMKDAKMNFVNDSAPMHIASAMNAKTIAIFCSTVPSFGFGPLSDNSNIVETKEMLDCRPCGIHGHKECPKGHFKCGFSIETNELIKHLA
ncbi:MAG: glycosyltransferase family 9 protein [Bacteroidetes bacterium]|nr:glycosyltransferase family 9 protein [Bacteroidota bacterium]